MVAQLAMGLNRQGCGRPVVVIGNGPAGVRCAQELYRHDPSPAVVLYGAERGEPYNRVRLSSLLAGEVRWEAFNTEASLPPEDVVVRIAMK